MTLGNERETYRVNEVARLLSVSRQAATELVENLPGVIVIERPAKNGKHRYRTIIVPRAVLTRLLGQLSNDGRITVQYKKKPRTGRKQYTENAVGGRRGVRRTGKSGKT